VPPASIPPARTRAELEVIVWGAVAFACLLAATFVIRPVRDALVLEKGRLDLLPVLFSATFVATLVLAPLWGSLLGRVPRRRFVSIGYHVTAACLLGFLVLIHTDAEPRFVGRVFYVWAAVANLFVVSVFWSVCADVLGPETARRLYGPIAVGGTVGAIAGPLLAKALVGWLDVDVDGVLVAAVVLIELGLFCVYGLERAGRRLADTPTAATVEPVRGHALDGLTDVGRSPYLAGIAAYVVFTACAATFVYMEQAGIVEAAIPDRGERTEFFATVDLYTNIGVLLIQAFVAARVLGWLGVGGVLAILPTIQAVGIIALLGAPTLATLVVVQVASRAVQHGLIRPGRELLFTVVSREQKYRAKNVIDTLIYRFGDVGSSWLHLGLVTAGLGGLSMLAVSLPIAGVWLATSIYLGVGFHRRRQQTLAKDPG
jgi:AAA family ATP:ADP antiporter